MRSVEFLTLFFTRFQAKKHEIIVVISFYRSLKSKTQTSFFCEIIIVISFYWSLKSKNQNSFFFVKL